MRSKDVLVNGRPSPGHQEGPGDYRVKLATAVRRRRRHTEVGQVTYVAL